MAIKKSILIASAISIPVVAAGIAVPVVMLSGNKGAFNQTETFYEFSKNNDKKYYHNLDNLLDNLQKEKMVNQALDFLNGKNDANIEGISEDESNQLKNSLSNYLKNVVKAQIVTKESWEKYQNSNNFADLNFIHSKEAVGINGKIFSDKESVILGKLFNHGDLMGHNFTVEEQKILDFLKHISILKAAGAKRAPDAAELGLNSRGSGNGSGKNYTQADIDYIEHHLALPGQKTGISKKIEIESSTLDTLSDALKENGKTETTLLDSLKENESNIYSQINKVNKSVDEYDETKKALDTAIKYKDQWEEHIAEETILLDDIKLGKETNLNQSNLLKDQLIKIDENLTTDNLQKIAITNLFNAGLDSLKQYGINIVERNKKLEQHLVTLKEDAIKLSTNIKALEATEQHIVNINIQLSKNQNQLDDLNKMYNFLKGFISIDTNDKNTFNLNYVQGLIDGLSKIIIREPNNYGSYGKHFQEESATQLIAMRDLLKNQETFQQTSINLKLDLASLEEDLKQLKNEKDTIDKTINDLNTKIQKQEAIDLDLAKIESVKNDFQKLLSEFKPLNDTKTQIHEDIKVAVESIGNNNAAIVAAQGSLTGIVNSQNNFSPLIPKWEDSISKMTDSIKELLLKLENAKNNGNINDLLNIDALIQNIESVDSTALAAATTSEKASKQELTQSLTALMNFTKNNMNLANEFGTIDLSKNPQLVQLIQLAINELQTELTAIKRQIGDLKADLEKEQKNNDGLITSGAVVNDVTKVATQQAIDLRNFSSQLQTELNNSKLTLKELKEFIIARDHVHELEKLVLNEGKTPIIIPFARPGINQNDGLALLNEYNKMNFSYHDKQIAVKVELLRMMNKAFDDFYPAWDDGFSSSDAEYIKDPVHFDKLNYPNLLVKMPIWPPMQLHTGIMPFGAGKSADEFGVRIEDVDNIPLNTFKNVFVDVGFRIPKDADPSWRAALQEIDLTESSNHWSYDVKWNAARNEIIPVDLAAYSDLINTKGTSAYNRFQVEKQYISQSVPHYVSEEAAPWNIKFQWVNAGTLHRRNRPWNFDLEDEISFYSANHQHKVIPPKFKRFFWTANSDDMTALARVSHWNEVTGGWEATSTGDQSGNTYSQNQIDYSEAKKQLDAMKQPPIKSNNHNYVDLESLLEHITRLRDQGANPAQPDQHLANPLGQELAKSDADIKIIVDELARLNGIKIEKENKLKVLIEFLKKVQRYNTAKEHATTAATTLASANTVSVNHLKDNKNLKEYVDQLTSILEKLKILKKTFDEMIKIQNHLNTDSIKQHGIVTTLTSANTKTQIEIDGTLATNQKLNEDELKNHALQIANDVDQLLKLSQSLKQNLRGWKILDDNLASLEENKTKLEELKTLKTKMSELIKSVKYLKATKTSTDSMNSQDITANDQALSILISTFTSNIKSLKRKIDSMENAKINDSLGLGEASSSQEMSRDIVNNLFKKMLNETLEVAEESDLVVKIIDVDTRGLIKKLINYSADILTKEEDIKHLTDVKVNVENSIQALSNNQTSQEMIDASIKNMGEVTNLINSSLKAIDRLKEKLDSLRKEIANLLIRLKTYLQLEVQLLQRVEDNKTEMTDLTSQFGTHEANLRELQKNLDAVISSDNSLRNNINNDLSDPDLFKNILLGENNAPIGANNDVTYHKEDIEIRSLYKQINDLMKTSNLSIEDQEYLENIFVGNNKHNIADGKLKTWDIEFDHIIPKDSNGYEYGEEIKNQDDSYKDWLLTNTNSKHIFTSDSDPLTQNNIQNVYKTRTEAIEHFIELWLKQDSHSLPHVSLDNLDINNIYTYHSTTSSASEITKNNYQD
ncbi:MAG: hypothetical protein K4H23_04875 [Mollicutes bacterium PWAP]|nr:hypothetical protein [Mollicutes bacterium PWAP]